MPINLRNVFRIAFLLLFTATLAKQLRAAEPKPRNFILTVTSLSDEKTASIGLPYREQLKTETLLCNLTQEVDKAWRFKDLQATGAIADVKVWKSPSVVRVMVGKSKAQAIEFDGVLLGREQTHFIRLKELKNIGDFVTCLDNGQLTHSEACKFEYFRSMPMDRIVAERNKVLGWTYATWRHEGKNYPCRILNETPLKLQVLWLLSGKVSNFNRVRTRANSVIETDDGTFSEATFAVAMQDVHPIQVMAATLRKSLPLNIRGKVVKFGGGEGFIDQGSQYGVRQGLSFLVYRSEGAIREEGTGKFLGERRKKVGEILIGDVQRNVSAFKLVNGEVANGDQIEFDQSKAAVAIVGLTDVAYTSVDGKLPVGIAGSDRATGVNDAGRMVSEQLTLALTNMDLRVVERALLQRVLAQVQLQQPGTAVDKQQVFDEKLAKQFGKQVGARFVVTGTVAAPPKSMFAALAAQRREIVAACYVRVIDVETGEIVASTAANVPIVGK